MAAGPSTILQTRYHQLLTASLALPIEDRFIAYDPDDCEAIEEVGPYLKRLEPRRKLKQKKGTPDDCDVVRPAEATVVKPPFDPERFNFTKIRPEERLQSLDCAGGRYHLVVNKYPAVPCHLLLVAEDLRPQTLLRRDLEAVHEVVRSTGLLAFYNSWSAAATVNHFHFQLFEGPAPIQRFAIEPADAPAASPLHMPDHPSAHLIFPAGEVEPLWRTIGQLLDHSQPHNLFFTPSHAYLFPRHPDPAQKGKELYGNEEPGGIEYAGIFIAYDRPTFDGLRQEVIEELLRKTTWKNG